MNTVKKIETLVKAHVNLGEARKCLTEVQASMIAQNARHEDVKEINYLREKTIDLSINVFERVCEMTLALAIADASMTAPRKDPIKKARKRGKKR